MIVNPSLRVVCLSLGGTKIQLGALRGDGSFLSGPVIYWRNKANYQRCLAIDEASDFCALLAQEVASFVQDRGFALEDVQVLGIPFPGPEDQRGWHSNNLTAAFKQGVDLQEMMRIAITRLGRGEGVPKVRVVFDAQCDAGGELYHPRGTLYGEAVPTATVLNIATGIAAGFVANGKVLIREQDFHHQISEEYDAEAGQLGRHIWYAPASGTWQYHYQPGGGTPEIDGIRMTERLSGPALAGRLLHRLASRGLLTRKGWSDPMVPWAGISSLLDEAKDVQTDHDLAILGQRLRAASQPAAGALLLWADQHQAGSGYEAADVGTLVANFGTEIAQELAGALRAWIAAPGWSRYGRRIVLTGGVGIRFLSSTGRTLDTPNSFVDHLQRALPEGCYVERSRLDNATERECYLFRYLPL